MSFWNKIGSAAERIGLVEKEEEQQEQSIVAEQTVPVVHHQVLQPSNVDAAKIAAIDETSRKMLIVAMQNDGAPLVEDLSDSLETLQEAIPDEKIRYVTALKMMMKRGTPVSAVLNDFDKCLGVLDDNKRSFENDSKKQLEQKVGTKVKAVQSLDGLIVQKTAEISKMQQELVELQAKRDQEQSGISVEQSKIDQVQSRFEVVYKAIRSSVEDQRAKVAQHGEGL